MEQKHLVTSTGEDCAVAGAVAVMLMMIHHLFTFPERLGEGISYISMATIGGKPVELLVGQFGGLYVMIFLFLAGYDIYLQCRDKEPMEMFGSLVREIAGLYRKYWMVFAVFIPLCLIRHVSRVTLDASGLFWNLTGMQPFYNGEWWFFAPLVLMLFFYPLLYRLSSRFRSPGAEVLAVILCNIACTYLLPALMDQIWEPVQIGSFCYEKIFEVASLLPAFWMGCIYAKYDVLSTIKQRLSGNVFFCIGSGAGLIACIPVRQAIGADYDYLMAPVYIACVTVLLNQKWGRSIRKILACIGTESIFIWLTHTMFCYALGQSIIFAPKYSVPVFLLLLVICLVTAKMLRFGMGILAKIWDGAKDRLQIQTPVR